MFMLTGMHRLQQFYINLYPQGVPNTLLVMVAVHVTVEHTVSQKNIPDIFDCNLKTNYQILIIFLTNIPDTTCHQMTI